MEKETCIAESYWQNGKLKKEEIINKDDILTIRDYTDEGLIWQEITYDEDYEKHGEHILYYQSGQIKFLGLYEHGLPHFQKIYNQKGQMLTEDIYVDGELKKRIITMLGIIEF
ncbi:MAG: hypothetical protein NTY74_16355 [Ignavibacteriae bacterium]|nr:hypothetical protein [Ignavibacteriota bacterium]